MDPKPPHPPSFPHHHEESGNDGSPHGDHVVLVLDDDLSIVTSLERLLTQNGYRVLGHTRPEDFFGAGLPSVPACLLLDNQLGDGMSGVEVYAELQRRGWNLPTVFVTAHWDVQVVVDAIRAGADGFLTKPYKPAHLLDAVAQALQRSRVQRHDVLQVAVARSLIASLTHREREIVCLVISGLLNKQIADQLGISLVTVKIHRGRAMRKLDVVNTAGLVRLASLAGLDR